jgi:DNA-directed RNA polymerase specialized sigma24 family protein
VIEGSALRDFGRRCRGSIWADGHLPAKDQVGQFELCYRREQRDLITRSLDRVSERERLVLSLHYGQDPTMKRIGDHLGIEESRVSQIHSLALHRLRSDVRSMLCPPLPRLSVLKLGLAEQHEAGRVRVSLL